MDHCFWWIWVFHGTSPNLAEVNFETRESWTFFLDRTTPISSHAKPNTFVGREMLWKNCGLMRSFSSLIFQLTRSIMSIMLGFGFLQESPPKFITSPTKRLWYCHEKKREGITEMLEKASPFLQSGSLKPTNTRNKHVANWSTANLKYLRSWHKRR